MLLNEIAFAKIIKDANLSDTMSKNNNAKDSILSPAKEFSTILRDLGLLRFNLEYLAENITAINVTDQGIKEKLTNWSSAADKLQERWLLSSLLYRYVHTKNSSLWMSLAGYDLQDTMVYCASGRVKCNEDYFEAFGSINSLACFTYDPSEGQVLKESNVQGLLNGVTFIFMTGGNLLASEYGNVGGGYWKSVPGYDNTFQPSTGSDGIRLMIHDPDTAPCPGLDGIDIAPGMATTIGLTSKETIRLGKPYGSCSTENIEGHLMTKSVSEKLGYIPPTGAGLLKSKYNAGRCRETCLLRHVWEHCGCLFFSGSLPFINSSLICGRIDPNKVFNATDAEVQKCFDFDHITTDECVQLLDPLLQDILCIQKVFEMESQGTSEDLNGEMQCHCPVPCNETNYQMTTGISKWPSPIGPEIDSAYFSIVQEKVIPYFERFNTTLTTDAIKYLNNANNSREIMNNFARVTVYIKSLKVDRVEQIPSYTAVDLISDIGMSYIFFLKHVPPA